jgi:hypothetical protein
MSTFNIKLQNKDTLECYIFLKNIFFRLEKTDTYHGIITIKQYNIEKKLYFTYVNKINKYKCCLNNIYNYIMFTINKISNNQHTYSITLEFIKRI